MKNRYKLQPQSLRALEMLGEIFPSHLLTIKIGLFQYVYNSLFIDWVSAGDELPRESGSLDDRHRRHILLLGRRVPSKLPSDLRSRPDGCLGFHLEAEVGRVAREAAA